LIRAKKSLGQNFLIDEKVLDQIVNCVEIEDKYILEIGPGTGNLTKYILNKKPKQFTVIEKDNDLIINLKDSSNSNINKISLHRKINSLIKQEFSNGLHALQIKIKN